MYQQIISGKKCNIYCEVPDPAALAQIYETMKQPYAVKGAVMPDCHKGYTLCIGGVVATKDVVVPSYVGFDIGCGVASVKTNLHKDALYELETLHQRLHQAIPVGNAIHKTTQDWKKHNHTKLASKVYGDRKGALQLGTLGGR